MLISALRFFEPLTHPINIVWGLNLLSGACFLWKRKWQVAVIPLVTAVFISVVGSSISLWLLGTLEKPYLRDKGASIPHGDAVVLLGGGHGPSAYDPNGFDVNEAGDRLLTAQELIRQGRARTLVIGGGGYSADKEFHSDGHLLIKWIAKWKVPPKPIFALSASGNTHDEAVKVRALVDEQHWKKVILVTSAQHMRRAEAVFRKAGVAVIPVACDFHAFGAKRGESKFSPFPNPVGFDHLAKYLHEVIGWRVYQLRGWVDTASTYAPPLAAKE